VLDAPSPSEERQYGETSLLNRRAAAAEAMMGDVREDEPALAEERRVEAIELGSCPN
jgi:hypothetical protein